MGLFELSDSLFDLLRSSASVVNWVELRGIWEDIGNKEGFIHSLAGIYREFRSNLHYTGDFGYNNLNHPDCRNSTSQAWIDSFN